MTARIEGSSPAGVVPESTDTAPTQSAAERTEANAIAQWSSPSASEAVAHIESSYGRGWFPDMESIDSDLSKLGGFDLLHALSKLDADEKLQPIINRMSPDERQQLVNKLVKENLLHRDSPNSKLQPKFALTPSMQKMVDELNSLQAREKRSQPLSYNWSAYREDPKDLLVRQMGDQVATLKRGDSVQFDAKLGAHGEHVTGLAEGKVGVARGADGMYTVSSELGAEAGVELHEKIRAGEAKAEAMLGLGGRVEYRFATAEQARAAAELFASSPPEAMEKYGRPDAVELKGKAAADFAAHCGNQTLKALKLSTGAEAQLVLRAELAGEHPRLALKAEGKLEGKAALELKVEGLEAEVRGHQAKASSKLELEFSAALSDPDAFVKAPLDYLRANGAKLGADAEAKATLSTETMLGHHSSVTEFSFSTSAADLQRLAPQLTRAKTSRELAAAVGEGIEVDVSEKKYELEHVGVDLKLDPFGHAGVDVGVGFERRHLEREQTVFRGSATELAHRL